MPISGFGQPITRAVAPKSPTRNTPHFGHQNILTAAKTACLSPEASSNAALSNEIKSLIKQVGDILKETLSDIKNRETPAKLEADKESSHAAIAEEIAATKPSDVHEKSQAIPDDTTARSTEGKASRPKSGESVSQKEHELSTEQKSATPQTKAVEDSAEKTATLETSEKVTSESPVDKTNTPESDISAKSQTSTSAAQFVESSRKLLNADTNLIEKFDAFKQRLPFLPKKGYSQSFLDHFKRAALRHPGEVEQAAQNIEDYFKLNQAALAKMRQIGQNPLKLAQLKRKEPEKLEDLVHVMQESIASIRKEIGKMQAYDRQNQTFFRMPFWSFSRANTRAVHQLDRALETYNEASDNLLKT